jgi:hypothetical protein
LWFPQVAPHLLASRLSLTGLVVLKEVLDESNVDALLERAAGLSEPEVQQLVTRLRRSRRGKRHWPPHLPPPWRQIELPPRRVSGWSRKRRREKRSTR